MLVVVLAFVSVVAAAPGDTIALPAPDTVGGMPLMAALKHRSSAREFSNRQLSDTLLGNLLWAAFGVNRPASGKRTAPSAMDKQEIDVYAALASGVYVYRAKGHLLTRVAAADVRAQTGRQAFVSQAPLNLVFVADLTRLKNPEDETALRWAAADAGFISQNVYLYCASAGLVTVVRGSFDEKELAPALKLGPKQKAILAQTVGFPAGK
jgi:SagB-type dehydrogenase family enzyme